MKQKYLAFYESVKKLCINAELSKPEDFKGVSAEKIEALEKELDIKLPDSLFVLFECFGEKLIVKQTEELLYFTLNDFKEAYINAKKLSIIDRLKDDKGLKSYLHEGRVIQVSDLLNIDNLLIINHNSLWRSYGFVDYTVENPYIYYIYNKIAFGGEGMSFTNYIRDVLFNVVRRRFEKKEKSFNNDISDQANENYLEVQNEIFSIKIDKIVWAGYYLNLTRNMSKSYYFADDLKFIELRKEFYSLISKIEQENKTILAVDEFEMLFIDFLKEKDYKTMEHY